ncbi:MAG: LPS export ABC transporter permease LptF [Gammaproteobacteria bacterium]|nr:LPS export ABC transporter permease LptF [Gammaproteobacteria bacterium]
MRKLDRYCLLEWLGSSVAVLVVLILVLMGTAALKVLRDVVEGRLPGDLLLVMMGWNMVTSLDVILPLSVFLGVLLGMGRFYRDSEMAAMLASGIGLSSLLRPMLYFGALVCCVSIFVACFAAPYALQQRYELQKIASTRSALSGIAAGRFNASSDGQYTLFVERASADKKALESVFLNSFSIEGNGLVTADSVQVLQQSEHVRYLVFEQGHHYQFDSKGSTREADFARYGVRLTESNSPVGENAQNQLSKKSIKRQSTNDLWRNDSVIARAELYWRLSTPLFCAMLLMLALVLSDAKPRQGRYARLGIAILVYIVYSNVLSIVRLTVEREQFLGGFNLWMVHLVMLVIIGVLFWQLETLDAPAAAKATSA